jgi:hypothetical protein
VIGALLVVLVAGLGIGGCSSGSSGSGTSTTSAVPTTTDVPATTATPATGAVEQLYAKALESVSHASSVHYVALSTGTSSEGTTHLRFVADVGVSSGTQVTTWSGANEKGSFAVITIGSATYLKADADSLVTFFGAIPAANASAYSGRWISFTPSDKLYSSLRGDLTLAEIAASLEFHPEADRRASGRRIVVTGLPVESAKTPAGEKASTSMTISSVTYLPEQQSFAASDNGATDSSSIVFSDWDTAATAAAPAGSITWASVAAAITPTTTTPG